MLGYVLAGVGVLGLVSGAGGKYFFVLPVITPPDGYYGSSAWAQSVPGLMYYDATTGKTYLTDDADAPPINWLLTDLGFRTNVLMGMFGFTNGAAGIFPAYPAFDSNGQWDFTSSAYASAYGGAVWVKTDPGQRQIIWDASQHQFGTLGAYGGWYMLALVVGGLVMEVV